MLTDHYPAYGLRLRTPRLELRLPDVADLARLADVAAAGIHDPAYQPFLMSWTDVEPAERARTTITHHLGVLAGNEPKRWALPFCVWRDGEALGLQEMRGRDFPTVREVSTGSWLGQPYQGQGIGTEMRAAVLHLAFAGLGAEYATSEAFSDNPSSYAVSTRLGYVDDGISRHEVRGVAAVSRRLRLSREEWEKHRNVPVELDGVDAFARWVGV